MTLDQLEILIQIKKGIFNKSDSSDLLYLIKCKWISSSLELTEKAEARLKAILSLSDPSIFDEQEIENFVNLITFEIKEKLRKRCKDFLKTREIRIKLHAHPEIMNELVTRYAQVGWEAAHDQGSILLKWMKPFNLGEKWI